MRQLRISSSRRGYKLKISPANCHYRVGASERMVDMMKEHFKDLPRDKTMTLLQLQYLLKRFQALQNSRPVARDSSHFLTRAHLLSGCEITFPDEKKLSNPVSSVKQEHSELFDQFLILQEESYLKINKHKFSSKDVPRKGDVCHIKSLPRHHYFSLGVIFHVEESSDGIPRTFWLRVMRPKEPGHPFPLQDQTSSAEAFRRDAQDLILVLRNEELSTSLIEGVDDAAKVDFGGDEDQDSGKIAKNTAKPEKLINENDGKIVKKVIFDKSAKNQSKGKKLNFQKPGSNKTFLII